MATSVRDPQLVFEPWKDPDAQPYVRIERVTKKFGDFIPLIRRGDIQGFVRHKPAWTIGKMNIEEMRQRAEVIELENSRFYKQAAERSSDPQVRKLLLDLGAEEVEAIVEELNFRQLTQTHLFTLQFKKTAKANTAKTFHPSTGIWERG